MKRGRVEEQLKGSEKSWSVKVSAPRKQTHLASERLPPQGELQVHTTRVREKVWCFGAPYMKIPSLCFYILHHIHSKLNTSISNW